MSRYRVVIQPRADADALDAFRWLADRLPAAITLLLILYIESNSVLKRFQMVIT